MGVDATLGDECGIKERLHFSEVKCLKGYTPRIYGWVYKTLRLSTLAVEQCSSYDFRFPIKTISD